MSLAESPPQPTAAESDSSLRSGGVFAVAAGHTVHDTYVGFLPVLLPTFVERFGLSNTRAGSLAALTQLPSILQPVFGHLADRLALRWVVTLAPAVTATLMSLVGWAPGYFGLAVLLLFVGISSAAFHAIGSATAGRLSVRHLGKGLSVWMVGGELGSTLGPILAASALTVLSLKGFSLVMFLGWTASLILYLRLRRAPARAIVSAERPELRQSLGRMRSMLLLMGGLITLRAMAISAPFVFTPIFLKQEGYSALVAAAGVTVFQASGMLGTLGAGWFGDRVGRRKVIFFGATVGPGSLIMFALLDGWIRFPFLALAGAAMVSMHPACMALVQETFPESRGLANAIYLSTAFVVSSVAAIVVGVLGDSIGLRSAFVVGALVTLLSIPLILMLPGGRTRSSTKD